MPSQPSVTVRASSPIRRCAKGKPFWTRPFERISGLVLSVPGGLATLTARFPRPFAPAFGRSRGSSVEGQNGVPTAKPPSVDDRKPDAGGELSGCRAGLKPGLATPDTPFRMHIRPRVRPSARRRVRQPKRSRAPGAHAGHTRSTGGSRRATRAERRYIAGATTMVTLSR